jgi:hypothetical protein
MISVVHRQGAPGGMLTFPGAPQSRESLLHQPCLEIGMIQEPLRCPHYSFVSKSLVNLCMIVG